MDAKQKKWEVMWDRYSEMEDGVREVVVALNLLGVNTIASCAGHMEHGVASPWVDVSSEMTEDLANLTKKADDLQEQAEVLLKEMTNDHHAHQLMAEYEEVRDEIMQKNLQQTIKLEKYLEEFYKNREVEVRVKLVLNIYGRGFGRLISQGGLYQEVFIEAEQNKNLGKFQKEMKEFGKFLKNKWIED